MPIELLIFLGGLIATQLGFIGKFLWDIRAMLPVHKVKLDQHQDDIEDHEK